MHDDAGRRPRMPLWANMARQAGVPLEAVQYEPPCAGWAARRLQIVEVEGGRAA